MRRMKPTPIEDQGFDLQGYMDELQTVVRSSAGAGAPVHELERGLWRRLLQWGKPSHVFTERGAITSDHFYRVGRGAVTHK